MRIALKVDVDTLRGTLEGVPALVRLFQRHQVQATFLFSLGPDNTGRALRRMLRPGFLSKVRRTSVVRHYGLRTLLYGTLLPGPDIGRRGAAVMRSVADAGHEVGVHCFNHVKWQDFVVHRNAEWTGLEMERAINAFQRVFCAAPRVHGAAGWQVNSQALALEESMGFDYASDTRGSRPFLPKINGEPSRCPQLPTTLPTLDELIGSDGVDATNVHERVIAAASRPAEHGHVYTLHAELEGMQLLPVMERLLGAWSDSGAEVGPMRAIYDRLRRDRLPVQAVVMGEIPGRTGNLALQGGV
ncbi:MAG: polysaccharide deacetylase family protein [Thiohalocapsa sp.]